MPLARLRDLEQRYDGPIPPQHREDAETSHRRHRGYAGLFETQALAFLNAAVRCETEIEDLAADLADRDGAQWQRDIWVRKLGIARARLEAHVACAAEAINRAAEKRRDLDMPPHPLVRLARLVANDGPSLLRAGVEPDK